MYFDVCICGRLASSKVNNAENSHDENSPNTYEMSSGGNTRPVYASINVQSETSAPATRDNREVPRSSINDVTLIDNDLYQ